jgi:hypothetical protein
LAVFFAAFFAGFFAAMDLFSLRIDHQKSATRFSVAVK